MFTTTGLFKSVPCPRHDRCNALNCIFSHDPKVLGTVAGLSSSHASTKTNGSDTTSDGATAAAEPPTKRRKLDPNPRSVQQLQHASEDLTMKGSMTASPKLKKPGSAVPQTLKKSITPPTAPANGVKSKPSLAVKEVLNPRLLVSAPTGHDKRTLYLRYLHDQMKRLNKLVQDGNHPEKAKLVLDDQELITASLDEEKQLAFDNPTVYANVIKQRIGAYKKMSVDDWTNHVKGKIFAIRDAAKETKPSGPRVIRTNLDPAQEVQILSELRTSPETLAKLGFILEPPTESAIEERRLMTIQSNNYEVCDRCKSRFQVFPHRRESDGVLTTNGPCTYHWGKMRYPKREKTDKITGSKDPAYICCGELLNSPGCTTCESHVFKMVEPARMAGVTQFIYTPDNPAPEHDHHERLIRAVTFDCEMSYTVLGLELTRLTAVTWPESDLLIDILVQPKGTILDYNTRFSGVTANTFRSAVPWEPDLTPLPATTAASPHPVLPLVADPETARDILCQYITPATPLLGHALENDMNAIRLCHKNIVDTIALYPHPKGLPIRYGLKALTIAHLGRDIQTGGEAGHDSLEDAKATGDLVRVKVGKAWDNMEKKGWKWKGDELVKPGGK
ncbi:Hypothetical protein D9617_3g020890 [Elsinoe fawcettii]|nr:Hypothetical protein D9617_3g020890 [Elsinoe fawcettii]